MKKLILLLSGVIVILLGAIGWLLNHNLRIDTEELDFGDSQPSNIVTFGIGFGDFQDEYASEGVVVGANYLISVDFAFVNDYEVLWSSHTDFKADDVLLKTDGTDHMIDDEGRIVRMERIDDFIRITYVDYSKLTIQTSILNQDRNAIGIDSSARISYMSETRETRLIDFGHTVINDGISATLENTLSLLPGTQVRVVIVKSVIFDVLLIPIQFLCVDNLGDYVYRVDRDQNGKNVYTKVYLTILHQNAVSAVVQFEDNEHPTGHLYAKIYW